MIERIISLFESVFKENPYMLIVNVLLFFAIFVSVFLIIKYIQSHNVFRKIVAKIKSDFREQERLREDEYKKQFEMEGQFESKNKMHRLNRKLIDSGLKTKYPDLTPEAFIMIIILFGILIGFFLYFSYKNIITTITGVILNFIVWAFYVEIKITNNFNSVEKETIKFVNLLKNVSHTEGSIAEMLGRTIPYIANPLRSNIEKCYYEIKATGNTSMALQHLCERTSYKKLREVFEALRVCSTHNEDYENVINESSQSIRNYIEYRQEMQQIKRSNVIDMLIMAIAGGLVLFEMRSMLTDIDVMYYIFQTIMGQSIIALLVIVLIYGIYKAIKNEDK